MRATSSVARGRIQAVTPGVRHLATGEVVTLRGGPERVVEVLEGQVWLTVEHVPEDAFPSAGDAVTVPKGRLLVVEALAPAVIRMRARRTLGERLRVAWSAVRSGIRARMTGLALS